MTTRDPDLHPDWSVLTPGSELTIVKQGPDGSEVTRYPATIIEVTAPGSWIGARATWRHGEIQVDGLRFMPGDTVDELFSPDDWFNAFHVVAPGGESRGWYANVTYPTRVETLNRTLMLVWQDLYIDVIVLPNGVVTVRDEDELAESGLINHDPALHQKIIETRDDILERARGRTFPFDQTVSNGRAV